MEDYMKNMIQRCIDGYVKEYKMNIISGKTMNVYDIIKNMHYRTCQIFVEKDTTFVNCQFENCTFNGSLKSTIFNECNFTHCDIDGIMILNMFIDNGSFSYDPKTNNVYQVAITATT